MKRKLFLNVPEFIVWQKGHSNVINVNVTGKAVQMFIIPEHSLYFLLANNILFIKLLNVKPSHP